MQKFGNAQAKVGEFRSLSGGDIVDAVYQCRKELVQAAQKYAQSTSDDSTHGENDSEN